MSSISASVDELVYVGIGVFVLVLLLILSYSGTSISARTLGVNATTANLAGGPGGYGVLIEANNIYNPGNIIAFGGNAVNNKGGGGGGGAIWLDYNNILSNAGTINNAGGTGDAAGGQGTYSVAAYNGVSGKAAPIPYVVFGVGSACTANLATGPCTGSITYNANTVLTGNINASNDIIINGGVILTTNGYALFAGNSLQNLGTITTGTPASIVAYSGGSGGSNANAGGVGSGNFLSLGGSGAGGQGCYTAGGNGGTANAISGGTGGAQQASGVQTCVSGTAGTSPTNAVVTNALVQKAFSGTNFALQTASFSGAAGGGAGTLFTPTGAGQNFSTYGSPIANTFGGALQLAVFALVFVVIIIAVLTSLKTSSGQGGTGGFLNG